MLAANDDASAKYDHDDNNDDNNLKQLPNKKKLMDNRSKLKGISTYF